MKAIVAVSLIACGGRSGEPPRPPVERIATAEPGQRAVKPASCPDDAMLLEPLRGRYPRADKIHACAPGLFPHAGFVVATTWVLPFYDESEGGVIAIVGEDRRVIAALPAHCPERKVHGDLETKEPCTIEKLEVVDLDGDGREEILFEEHYTDHDLFKGMGRHELKIVSVVGSQLVTRLTQTLEPGSSAHNYGQLGGVAQGRCYYHYELGQPDTRGRRPLRLSSGCATCTVFLDEPDSGSACRQ